MDLEDKFRSKVDGHLNKLTPQLTEVLRQLQQHDYPTEVVLLAFEVFTDGFTEGFPVRVFFLNADNTEVFIQIDNETTYPSPVDPGLLNIERVYSDALEEEYTEEDEFFPVWDLATEQLILWFAGCWNNTGVANFTLQANIAPHDSIHRLNLITGKEEIDI